MHRIAHLATKVFTQPGDRLLFTTYTKNLAADIRAHLASILPAEALARVEVVNLDAWVFERLKAAGVQRRMAFGAEVDQIWRRVVSGAPANMSAAFLHEEFEKVILAQGLDTPQAYLTASRVGRGTLLGRRERLEAWKVFQAFREALADKGMMPAADAMREVRRQLEDNDAERPYRAVVVDESQDFGAQAFLLLRQLVPTCANDLFLVGDAHQRIYGHKVVLSRCGIEVRGRSHRLRINYRTTDEIRGWAVRLLDGQSIDDLDGGQDSAKGYKSLMHGEPPEVRTFPTVEAELDFLAERLKAWEAAGVLLRSVCVVARTATVRDALTAGLKKRGVATYVVDKEGDRPEEAGVRLATMHRVKGLEFERVIVAQVNDGVVPLTLALGGGDAVAVSERELGERSLLYVAVTRAKREALITAGGKPSPFIGNRDQP
jgi:superfamily I DNA/RNA helicase